MNTIDNIMALALNYRLAGSASRDEHEEALRTALTKALAVKPVREPLSDKQIQDLIQSKHFDKRYKLKESDEVILNWYRLGLKDCERAHGIGVQNE